jgi:ABC transporter DrrB family efflux protein
MRVGQCSFLDDKQLKQPGLNPFFRDGVDVALLDVTVLRDPTQLAAASIIEQVAQVTLLRVVMPWMIGRAFEEVGKQMPIAVPLLTRLFAKYDLTAKTWVKLTRSQPTEMIVSTAHPPSEPGTGVLNRGSLRYQILVPSLTVTFAFFLVITTGGLFVAERRQGTLLRLRLTPLHRWQILAGKLLPCFLVSVVQGLLLLIAGKIVFGMDWGAHPWWLFAVAICTSVAATGMALMIASWSKTESQVAVYGTLLVLVLAGVSGCLMPRDLMPEAMRQWSKVTPHAWALDAYNQLLLNPQPELGIVASACGMLLLFGVVFLLIGWWRLELD